MANFSVKYEENGSSLKKKFYFSCKSIRFDFLKNALKNEVVKVEKVDAPIYLKSKSLLRVVVGKKVSVKFHSPLTNSVVRYSHCSKIPFHAPKTTIENSRKLNDFEFLSGNCFGQNLDFCQENSIFLILFRVKFSNFWEKNSKIFENRIFLKIKISDRNQTLRIV